MDILYSYLFKLIYLFYLSTFPTAQIQSEVQIFNNPSRISQYNSFCRIFSDLILGKSDELSHRKIIIPNGWVVIESQGHIWRDSSWRVGQRIKFEYDLSGNITKYDLFPNGIPQWKKMYTFDTTGYLVMELEQYRSGERYNNKYKGTYIYDTLGDLSRIYNQNWQDSNWVNDSKAIFTRDINGGVIKLLIQGWQLNKWIDGSQFIYIYDAKKQMLEKSTCLSQKADGEWSKNSKFSFLYDNKGHRTVESCLSLTTSGWAPNWKKNLSYDSLGRLYEEIYLNWIDSSWKYFHSTKYTYKTLGNIIKLLFSQWNGTNWLPSSRITYTFDENQILIKELTQHWIDNGWVNLSMRNYMWKKLKYIEC